MTVHVEDLGELPPPLRREDEQPLALAAPRAAFYAEPLVYQAVPSVDKIMVMVILADCCTSTWTIPNGPLYKITRVVFCTHCARHPET